MLVRRAEDTVKSILLVEDEPAILGLLTSVVSRDGYTVLKARSTEEALLRFEENDGFVDLLIADVTLPTSSGVHLAVELRALLPFLRIILTSGYPSPLWDGQDADELSDLPSDSVITLQKPFRPESLLEHIHRMIGLSMSPKVAKVGN
jgi:DNA-binding response OmpR family regulator